MVNYPGRVLSSVPLTWGQLANFRGCVERELEPVKVNMVLDVTLDREVSVGEAMSALRALANRYEALRTAVDGRDPSRPRQVILEDVDIPVFICDPDGYSRTLESCRHGNLLSLASLVWKVILSVDAGHVVKLTLVVHHMVGDGRSLSLIVSELRRRLAGIVPGTHRVVQPREIALSQQSAEKQARVADYFRRYYANAPRPSGCRDDAAAWSATRIPVDFPGVISSSALRSAAMTYAVTPATVLLMITVLLIDTLTDDTGGTINLVAGNRLTPDDQETVDCFAMSVPIWYRMALDEDLTAAARRLHREAMRAYSLGGWSVDAEKAMRTSAAPGLPSSYPKYTFNYFDFGSSEMRMAEEMGRAPASAVKRDSTEDRDRFSVVLVGVAAEGEAFDLHVICSTYLAQEDQVSLMGMVYANTLDYLSSSSGGAVGDVRARIVETLGLSDC